jgi:LysR family transcriptional regulator, glycine cleavage system transcriptional activator
MPAAPSPDLSRQDLRLPSIDGLRAFEATARLGSHERAADELAVTASAVGKRIATLEDLLGAALFARSGKGLALTAVGKEYLEQVRAALGLLAAMPLHQRQAQRLQRLRVTAPPTFARQVLVPRLAAFTAAHPQVELELVLSIPYLGQAPGDTDIEVRHAAQDEPGATVLMREKVLPVAAPALVARLGRPAAPADLHGWPLLRTPLEPWAPWFRAAGLDWPEPAQGPRFVDLGLTLEAAVSGQGVALARPTLARDWLASGTLVPLFAQTAEPARRYQLMPHADHGAAATFAQWLLGICAEAERDAADWLSGLA